MLVDLAYLGRLRRSLWRTGPSWPRAAVVTPAVVAVLGALAAYGYTPAARAEEQDPVAGLEARAEWVGLQLERVQGIYAAELAPLERVLLTHRDNPALARRIAVALYREGRAAGIAPDLLLAVLLVENPWVNPAAISPVGARGLMQVMPLHRGEWPPCAPRLDDVDANICHGARIFAAYLEQQGGDLERALLRYNGCVRGTNTPDCGRYADQVFARFGRTSVAGAALD